MDQGSYGRNDFQFSNGCLPDTIDVNLYSYTVLDEESEYRRSIK